MIKMFRQNISYIFRKILTAGMYNWNSIFFPIVVEREFCLFVMNRTTAIFNNSFSKFCFAFK